MVLPGETIGILGGGQLGRMVAMEAKKMDYQVICLDPTPNSPCGQVSDDQIVAPFDDLEAALELAERSTVVFYEFENIDAGVVQELEGRFRVPQGSRILSIAQDRSLEKTELQKAGFPVAPFKIIRHPDDLIPASQNLGLPCVLKLSRGGYDGKGQMVIGNRGEMDAALQQVGHLKGEWVLEKMVDFTHECSAIVARSISGETAVFPVAENIHRDNILFLSIVPPRIPQEMEAAAAKTARGIAEAFDVRGLLAVEFFVTQEGLLVNELAPRPHNSGHYTFDACYTSQFEQMIRALCGLPLGPASLLTPAVMVNILGEHITKARKQVKALPPGTKLHLYGKRGAAPPKRKMGHLTVKTGEPGPVIDWARRFFSQ